MSKNKGKTSEELLLEALVPEEEHPYPIPGNWIWVKLGFLITVKSGYALTKNQMIDGPYPVYGGNGVNGFHKENNIYETSIIVGRVGFNCGSVHLSEKYAWVTDNAFIVSFDKTKLDIKYLYWLLKNLNLGQYSNSTAQPVISGKTIYPIKFPLPPLEEQKRIADKVERLLNKINQAKQLIEEAKETFELRRSAILDKAFRGELKSKWRMGNIGSVSAEELLLEINEKKKSNKKKEIDYKLNFQIDDSDLPKGWVYCRLGDVIESFKYGTSSKSDYTNKGTPVLRIPNVDDFTFNLNDMKYSEGVITSESHLVSTGDILIIRSNGSKDLVGKCSVVTKNCDGFAYASYLIRLRPIGVVPEFVLMLLKSKRVRNQLFKKSKSSAGINNINIEELSSIVIPIAPFEEQKEIVKVVRNLFEKEDVLFGSLNVNENFETLISSVLSKAFRGELGTNVLTDESAASLMINSLQE